MVSNKADTIEEYILKKLAEGTGRSIEVKRTELADVVNCAPSQVSYVLSTRFTHDRGFRVESQRGLGGYIRVTIIEDVTLEKKSLYRSLITELGTDTTFETVHDMLEFLIERRLITRREAELVAQTAYALYKSEKVGEISPEERTRILRTMFITLSDF